VITNSTAVIIIITIIINKPIFGSENKDHLYMEEVELYWKILWEGMCNTTKRQNG
jgi:hypothetical protein